MTAVRRHAFVAHQRSEADIVQFLGVALLPTGWRLNDIIPYVDGWQALAADAIEEAQAFILVATPASLASEACRFEWEWAARLDKPIVRLDVEIGMESLASALLAGRPSLVVDRSTTPSVEGVVNALTAACGSAR